MSSLIPFQDRPERPSDQVAAGAPAATIVDVASHAARSRSLASRRRPRRNWDPAFHVDLLTF